MKKKKYDSVKAACKADREREIKAHGKIISCAHQKYINRKKRTIVKKTKFQLKITNNIRNCVHTLARYL
jgi:hypothetical protein